MIMYVCTQCADKREGMNESVLGCKGQALSSEALKL